VGVGDEQSPTPALPKENTALHQRCIRLTPRSVTRVLSAAAVLLVTLSVAGQLYLYLTPRESPWGIVGLFNVDFEMNVPTLFAVLVLLLAATLLAVIAVLERQAGGRHVRRWTLLSLGMAAIGCDEFLALHEKASEPLRRLLGWETMGYLHFAWVIPGAIGVEMVGGRYAEAVGTWNLTYSLITTVEESLELAGTILFIDALLRYLAAEHAVIRLEFAARPAGEE
jgi:hypothetical protein